MQNDAKTEASPTNTDIDPFAAALAEWDAIPTIPVVVVDVVTTEGSVSQATSKNKENDQLQQDCSYEEPLTGLSNDRHRISSVTFTTSTLESINQYIQEVELSNEFPKIQKHPRGRSNKLIILMKRALFLSPQKIRSSLKSDRDRIFALALKQFDNTHVIQCRMLTSLYQQLMIHSLSTTASQIACPRIGSHWESIGFQGIDPVSDLRGVGLLGLYQLCFLTLSSLTSQLAADIFNLSTGGRNPCRLSDSPNDATFPFAVTGLNMSQLALYCLRKGLLNNEINRRGPPVFLTFNLFYSSLYLTFARSWESTPNASIAQAGTILRDMRRALGRGKVRANILQVLSYGESKAITEGYLDVLKSNNNLEEVVCNRVIEATESSVVFSDIGNIVETSTMSPVDLKKEGEEIGNDKGDDEDTKVFTCLERAIL
jgi:hypothetical protein